MKGSDIIELDKELKIVNAKVYEYDFKTCNAVVLKKDGYYYIGIRKGMSELERYWVLEHELEHIKQKAMYQDGDCAYIINKKERITNDALILKLGLPSRVYELLMGKKEKTEICQILGLSDDVFEYTLNYLKRNQLKILGEIIE